MQHFEIDVTPQIAESFLEKNTKNRKIDWNVVHSYAEMMRRGEWQLMPEGISFYEDGSMRNGQHRCRAVIESGMTVRMDVAYGVPNESVICDNQKPRSLQNYCQLSGYSAALSTKAISTLVTTLFYQRAGRMKIGEATKLKFIRDEAEYLEKAYHMFCAGSRRIANRAPVSAAIYCALRCGVSESVIKRFIEVAESGFQQGEHESAAIVLRNKIMKLGRGYGGGRAIAEDIFSTTLKAIRDFELSKPRTRDYKRDGKLPYFDEIKETVLSLYSM